MQEVDPLGAVVLTNYTLVKARDAGKQHAFKIIKYKARTYYFYTETEEDMNRYVEARVMAPPCSHPSPFGSSRENLVGGW